MAVELLATEQPEGDELAGVADSAWLLESIERVVGEMWADEVGKPFACVVGHPLALPAAQLTFRHRDWTWVLNVCRQHWESGGLYLARSMSLVSVRRALTLGEGR
jgi:hypothetical protein